MSATRLVIAYNGADAGLGNRLRVTLGAARYARFLDARFGYVWPRGPLFEPAFTDLWEWGEGMRVSRAVSRAVGLLSGYVGNRLTEAPRRAVLQIRTGAELVLPPEAGSWTDDLRALRPVDEIARTVHRLHGGLASAPYVGVQLRVHRVSHRETTQTSPASWFTERMHAILAERPGTRFYLSCDVPEVKRTLLQQFPTAVAHEVDAPYNSTAAVRAAIVDLYLLAASSRLLGPHHSSFIEMAQFLGDLRVPTDKPTEPAADTHAWWTLPPATDPLRPADRAPRAA
ncbi:MULTISPECIES: O-fucosyltransferase family protein [Microbacterium]|uniref:hypothetical protein n=1 Tax=Microbacterium TaxID=33882 RepID=UPI00300FB1C3